MSVTDTHVIGDYTAAITIDGATHFLLIQPGNASTAYKKISRNVLLSISGDPLGTTDSQSVSNKTIGNTNTITLKDTLFTLQDDGDTTKQAKFQLSGITTATTRTYTLPNASSTLADIATAQTLTNKTLTSPVITGGSIDNSTVTVDTIAGHTASTTGSIYGISVASGAIQANSAIKDGIILPKSLLAGTGSSWTWQSWTPTFTVITVGNGVHDSKFTVVGTTVICVLQFTFGNTSAMATGTPTFTLPITAAALVSFCYLGNVRLNTSTSSPGIVRLASTTTGDIKSQKSDGTYLAEDALSATVPGNWGTSSTISGIFVYEAA